MAEKAALVIATAGLAAGSAAADSEAAGVATHSPSVLSGNLIQIPVHVPVNVSGNTVNVIGLLNPAFGNEATNA
ncbi:chaplin [Streptomyces sp. A5-4]|uniref:chaplin n=1 Tax=Streptomyces sp. A5-4 TaxID=3384771 RepID=UPI003DA99B25